MKKKILVFLVFAGFLLVGGLNVNFAEAVVTGCGSADGQNFDANVSSLPSNFNLCDIGYSFYDDSQYAVGFYFPAVGGSTSWQCRKDGIWSEYFSPTIVTCNASRKYYTCPTDGPPPGATRCGGDDEKYITSPVSSWTPRANQNLCSGRTKCEYYISVSTSCCGTFDGQPYSSWPAPSATGFCNPAASCSPVNPSYAFPTNAQTATASWDCKNILGVTESCSATKTASAPVSTTYNGECAYVRGFVFDYDVPTWPAVEGGNGNLLCMKGSAEKPAGFSFPVQGGQPVTWRCLGGGEPVGTTADCSVSRAANQTNPTNYNCGDFPLNNGGAVAWDDEEKTDVPDNNTKWQYSLSDTPIKCEFKCSSGTWNGLSCVAETETPITISLLSANPTSVLSGNSTKFTYSITGSAKNCDLMEDGIRKIGLNIGINQVQSIHPTNVNTVVSDPITKSYYIRCFDSSNVEYKSTNKIDVTITYNPDYATAEIITPTAQTTTVNIGETVKFEGKISAGTASGYFWSDQFCSDNVVPSSTLSTFNYKPTSCDGAGTKTIYFRVKRENSQWSPCQTRTVIVKGDTVYRCTGTEPNGDTTKMCPLVGFTLVSSPLTQNTPWTNAGDSKDKCDPKIYCQYYTTSSSTTDHACHGSVPDGATKCPGEWGNGIASIDLVNDVYWASVGSDVNACSANPNNRYKGCEYYTSSTPTSCKGTRSLNSTVWGDDESDASVSWKYSASDTTTKCEYKCNQGFQWFTNNLVSGCQPIVTPAPTATCDASGKLAISWQGVAGEGIWYALRIDDTSDTWAGDVPIGKDAVINNLTTTSYNTYQGEIGKTYRVWANPVVENGVNDIWGDRTGNLVTMVTCSGNQNDASDAEDEDTTPEVVDLGLCGPAGSFDKTQPKTYDWTVSAFTEKLCIYGDSNPVSVALKMGRRVNWTCYNEAKTTSQKCYAKRNSNGNIDTTPDENEDTGGNGNGNSNGNGNYNGNGNSNTGATNSNPKCGTADKKFYEATNTSFGNDTLCASGIASPLAPVFPDEGKIVEWKCSKSGNWVLDTLLLKKVVSCASARKNSEITPGCGDASGNYSGTATNFRSTNFCASGLNLSSGTPIFPTVVGGSTDWVCRPSLLSTIFTNKKPVVCNATKGSQTSTPDTTPTEETAFIGTGDGLLGKYFDNWDFTAQKLTLVDPVINFNWGYDKPNNAIEANTFSIRWTGSVQPKYSGEWTFYVTADDGVRLWVNDQLLIDKWIDQVSTEYNSKITLTAGQKYNIKMEYYENGGNTVAKLAWSHAKQNEEIIPKTQLYSN